MTPSCHEQGKFTLRLVVSCLIQHLACRTEILPSVSSPQNSVSCCLFLFTNRTAKIPCKFYMQKEKFSRCNQSPKKDKPGKLMNAVYSEKTMDAASSSVPALSGFLPTGSLVESLIQISGEVLAQEKLPSVQLRNSTLMIRRIKLLSSLFEEIHEANSPLHVSTVLCLTELFSVIKRVKLLIQECTNGSYLWSLTQTDIISNQFHVLVKEMGMVLDILPLGVLDVTADTRELVQLLHKQAKRAELFVDARELQRRKELFQVMKSNNEKNTKDKGFIDFGKFKEILSSIGFRSPLDYEEEKAKLETEAQKQAGTGGLIVISNINNLISLLSYSKLMIINEEAHEKPIHNFGKQDPSLNKNYSRSLSVISNLPDEFRCPISLDLMKDPVIVASGHTYDRNSIAQWINSGHHTCPKSGQRLIHMALIPNYALKSLVYQWCQENNNHITVSSTSDSERGSSKRKLCENAVDHISATKSASNAVKMTAEFLVGKLATGSAEIQRQAAYELRLLAKTGMDNRRIIAEAGAIPFLVTLLCSRDPRIQENSVTALLNLSLYNNNKILIMAAGAIGSIIDILELGKTMEARENAAAAIFSMSIINDCRMTIGTHPRAIPALVGLLREGTPAGKRDAATALFNLAVHSANKASVVAAGAVPLLINLLLDEKAGVTDDAMAVLALLLGCAEGLKEIRNSRIVVPLLIDLLRFGSLKGKENSIILLLGLCKDGGDDVARGLLMNPQSILSLKSLAADGSTKARRKTEALLRLLDRCCSMSDKTELEKGPVELNRSSLYRHNN